MRTIRTSVAVILLFIFQIQQVLSQSVPLNGTYTIGLSGNFPSFKATIDSLVSKGISGPVVFNIKNGTYNEQISIPVINGSSAINTITYQSESNDSTQVILSYSGSYSSNYTLQLNGASYITFNKISLLALNNSYGRVIDIKNGSNHNTFKNCILQGIAASSTSENLVIIYSAQGSIDNYNTFAHNRILNGSQGFLYYGSQSLYEKGTKIENNSFENQYFRALVLCLQDSIIIQNNSINTNSLYSSFTGILCTEVNNQLNINKNKIYIPNGGYGIYLLNCNRNSNVLGLVANNFVTIGGTGTAYGIYLASSEYQRIYNNSINILGTSAINGRALFIETTISGLTYIENNILTNIGGGYCYYVYNPSVVNISDHNDYYTTGQNIAYWSGNIADLTSLQLINSKDIHSISCPPLFVSNTELRPREIWLNGSGTPLSEITNDIDEELRNTTNPDIGADEFTPIMTDAGIYAFDSPKIPFKAGSNNIIITLKNHGAETINSVSIDWSVNSTLQTRLNWTGTLISGDTALANLGNYNFNPGTPYNIKSWTSLPNGHADLNNTNDTIKVTNLYSALSGTYTIGATNPDFLNFQAAITALKQGGISANVIFKIRNGTYEEQLSIPEIKGTSKNSTITFESESGDSTGVILSYSANYSSNYTLQIKGADNIKFNKITIRSINSAYGRVIQIGDSSNYNIFSNCILQGAAGNSEIVYLHGVINGFNVFKNNRILNGSYGIYFTSASNNKEKCIVLENNIFENQNYIGIHLNDQDSIIIRNNIINTNSSQASFKAIYLANCTNKFIIEKNRLYAPNGGYGLHIENGSNNNLIRGLIANNFIQVGGTGTAYGIFLYRSYIRIYNNNVNISSISATGGSAVYLSSAYYINMQNNILANSGKGYALYTNPFNSTIISDYNDLFTNGVNIAYWQVNIPTLQDLQIISNQETNSISENPYYYSATDLHVRQISLNKKGNPIALITSDIDGDIRDVLAPDIGADEFSPTSTDAGIYAITEPEMPFSQGNHDVSIILKNHGANTLNTITINWTVNNINQPGLNWNGSLPSGKTIQVKLGTYNFAPLTAYSIKSWTILPNGQADVINYNDTAQVSSVFAALAGTYTIGGASPNFNSFQDAVYALIQSGIVGNVIFKIRDNTYNEQIIIPEIIGASESSTIVFEPESGDSTSVVLSFSANNTNNFTLQLNGADYFRFNKLNISATNSSYATVISIKNGANHNIFSQCTLKGIAQRSYVVYSEGFKDEYNKFINNVIINGNYGIYFIGLSTADLEKGNIFENNSFLNQNNTGIYSYYQDSLVIRKNYVNTNSTNTGFYSISCNYCNNTLIIEKNKLYAPNGTSGLYVNYCVGTSSIRGLIANNFIQVGGTSSAYGLYIIGSNYQRILNNNINITSTSANNNYAINFSSSQTIDLVNNILANSGGGYSLYTTSPSTFLVTDYNDLYTTGTNLAFWSGNYTNLFLLQFISEKNLHSISTNPQFVSTTDLHVKEVALNNSATPLAIITEDIDNEIRSALNPDIGADEFNPFPIDAGMFAFEGPKIPFSPGNKNVILSIKNFGSDTINTVAIDWKINNNQQSQYNWSGTLVPGDTAQINIGSFNFIPLTKYTIDCWTSLPNGLSDVSNDNDTIHVSNLYVGLNGTYTVGGTTPDFQNFTEAITALYQGGIIGSVVFKVRAGTYNEQISISKIPGTTKNKPISFESESGDSSTVILSYSANVTNNFTLQLNGAQYITFNKLTIQATNTDYGNVIDIKNISNHNTFSHCILRNVSGNSAIINSIDSKNDYNSFINNKIINGYYGIDYEGADKGTIIENNIFENQKYTGINFSYQDSLIVQKNVVITNSSSTAFCALYCSNCNNNLRIEKNRFFAPNGQFGIRLNSYGSSSPGLIANNFIQVGGTSSAYGIYCQNVYSQMIYNNNIYITNTNAYSSAIYITYGSSSSRYIDLRNNILYNSGVGYALYTSYSNTISISDYNDFYTNGTNLAFWAGNRVTLSDLQLASNKDSHSISIDPKYFSTTDLHVRESSLNSAGIQLSIINNDIDGDLRNIIPDIGADEFDVTTPDDAGIIAIIDPKMPFLSGNKDVYVILRNFGSANLIDATIKWSVNNITQTQIDWHGLILSSATDTVNIGSFNFLPLINHSIKVWSENPNGNADVINNNDTTIINNLFTAINGSFTIGGFAPDFKTFSEAANMLTIAGITGPVTFNVRSGIYKNHIEIGQVFGSSATNKVIFRSENRDSTSVTLMDSANITVISINDADYITFTSLTIKNAYPNSGKVIELINGASNNQFLNNIIIGGSYGIDLKGININNPQIGNTIENNSFKKQSNYAVNSLNQENLSISNNTIHINSSLVSVYGIYLNNCKGSLAITKNKISIVNDGYGIYVNNYSGNSINQGFIANNFISIGGTKNAYGIYSGYNIFLNIYNNTINIKNTLPAATAFYYQDGVNSSLINNIFSNTGGGIALAVGNLSSIKISDYNDLFTTGENLVTYNHTLYKNLASWKSVSNMESHSVSVDPMFYSDSDLHISQIALDSAGISLPLITDDIDGDIRDLKFPDIGADEFENTTHDLSLTAILPVSGCMLSNNESVIVTVKNLGAYPESKFNVVYSIDNSLPVIENVSQTIPAGGTMNYTFNKKANLSVIKSYLLRTYVDLSADENSINDTLVSSVSNMPKLEIKLTEDITICPGTNVKLTASGANSYRWNTGSTQNSINVNPSYTTSYIVRGINLFNCEDVDTVTLRTYPFPPIPTIVASGPTTFCNNGSVVLTSSIDSSIIWSTYQETPSITVYNTGLYSVKYTDSNGCSSLSMAVKVTEEPSPIVVPYDTTICSSGTVKLTVKYAVKYLWSTGASTQSITVSPSVTSTYNVTATTALGCQVTAKSTIHVLPSKTPGQVTDMIPATGVDGLSLPLEVSWMPADNASYYDLFIWPENLTKPTNAYASNLDGIRFKFGKYSLSYGETYNWQIISKYYGCASTPGPVQTFKLRHLPDLVVNNVQIPSTAFTGQEIEITWDVKNQGIGNTANQTWADDLSLSLDNLLDDFYSLGHVNNMTYLEPGQSYSKKAPFTLPPNKDGLFNIFVWANRSKSFLETKYDNNQGRSSNPIWVKLTPPPDLFVSEVITPSDFFSEDTINVSWTVVNKGTWPTQTSRWYDRVYISQDFNTSKRYSLGDFAHSGDTLKPDETYTTTHAVVIPEGIFGKYYFFIETDVSNNVQEHAYDGNNVTQSDSVNVILRPPADLEVSDIIIPKNATNIGTANIKWKVTNIGNSSPRDNEWTDAIYLSTSPEFKPDSSYFFSFRRTISSSGIPLNYEYYNSEDIKIPNDIAAGDYYVYVKTDNYDKVFEYIFNENNLLRSETTIKITIAPWPDLIVSKLSHPKSAGACEKIPVSYTVTNTGTAIAKGGWTDSIYIYFADDRSKSSIAFIKEIKRYDKLDIDSSYTVNADLDLPVGFRYGSNNYEFNVSTDAYRTIYEYIDENNNRLTDNIFIKPSDLKVQTTNIPATIYSGTKLSVSWMVENTGNASTPSLYWFDKVDILDSLNSIIQSFQYIKNSPVKPGTSYTYQDFIEIPDGIYGNFFIRITADAYNSNRESIRSNNVKLVPVKIILRPPTDLIVNSLTLPTSGMAGQPITIIWQVKNAGPGATLASAWNDIIFLSSDTIINPREDILLGIFPSASGLTSGETYNQSEQVFLPINTIGNYYVIVKTDYSTEFYGNEYEYQAEDNNTAYSLLTINLAPPSDLIVTNITAPANAITGESITIEWTIKNLGPNKAQGYLTDMVYFSKDATWDVEDKLFGINPLTINLSPSEEMAVSLTTELTGTSVGNYYVIVRTDNKNNINEVNDLNNTLSSISQVNVEVPLLTLNVLEKRSLLNDKGLYYRIEIPDSLIDETLLVSLTGDTISGANELFISYDTVPDRSDYDFTSRKPFYGNQEVMVPSLKNGTYYLLVYGNVSSGNQQDISILAQIINFQIRSIEANKGGNKGMLTAEMYGAKFTNNMQVKLHSSSCEILADTMIFMDATRVFVTFNLMDAPLDVYDVIAINAKNDTTILKNGFEVVENSPFGLVTSVKAPGRMRAGSTATIAVQFANDGNIDLTVPKFKLISEDLLPIAFLKKDLNKGQIELEFELREVNGPQHVLRPGAINSLYIWVWANRTLTAHFRFE